MGKGCLAFQVMCTEWLCVTELVTKIAKIVACKNNTSLLYTVQFTVGCNATKYSEISIIKYGQ